MPLVSPPASDALTGRLGPESGLGFPRAARVRAKAEFDRVFKGGRRSADPHLALHWLNDNQPPRLGLAVSRKVDKRAVGRNRIKRILREHFRKLRPGLCGGAYVVVARTAAAQASGPALRASFDRSLQRLGALPRPSGLGTMPPANPSPAPHRMPT